MDNQDQNVTHQLYVGLRYMMVVVGIILFFAIGIQMLIQADNRQAVIGQPRQVSK